MTYMSKHDFSPVLRQELFTVKLIPKTLHLYNHSDRSCFGLPPKDKELLGCMFSTSD